MQRVMTHRSLPTREGRLVYPGTYYVHSNPYGYITLHTQGSPTLMVGSMTYEQYNKAINELWITALVEAHAGTCRCSSCDATRALTAGRTLPAANPFKGLDNIFVSQKSIAAWKNGMCVGAHVQ